MSSSPTPPARSGNAFYLILASAPFFGLVLPLLLFSLEFFDVLLLSLLLVLLLGFKCVYFVKPAERVVILDIFTGAPLVLESGLHWIWNPKYYRKPLQGSSWAKFGKFPEIGSRVRIDPSAAQVHTMDGITASADVSLECVVREWSAGSMIKDGGCIHSRACATVNQWLSEQLASLNAEECTYGHLNLFLNAPERIDALNSMLASGLTHLSAHKVVMDVNGIQLSPAWLAQREEIQQKRQLLSEREKVLERELHIQTLEQAQHKQVQEYQLMAERQRVEHEAANSKLLAQAQIETESARAQSELESLKHRAEYEDAREARKLQQATEHGLSAEQYCRIAIARVHFETMAQSQGTKYLCVPPGMLGLGVPCASIE